MRLFIRDSFEDRVNFWNSKHNYEESKHFNPAFLSMRIPTTNIYDQTFTKYLRDFILYKYSAIFSNGQVKLYSYSFSKNELIKFKDILDLGSLVQIPRYNKFIPQKAACYLL